MREMRSPYISICLTFNFPVPSPSPPFAFAHFAYSVSFALGVQSNTIAKVEERARGDAINEAGTERDKDAGLREERRARESRRRDKD